LLLRLHQQRSLGALLREETAEVERGDGDTKTRNMLHEGVPVQLLPD